MSAGRLPWTRRLAFEKQLALTAAIAACWAGRSWPCALIALRSTIVREQLPGAPPSRLHPLPRGRVAVTRGAGLREAAGNEERELEEEEDAWEALPQFDEPEWHKAPTSWPPEAKKLFVPLGPHDMATAFVRDAPVVSWPKAMLYNFLCRFPLDEFDLQSWLYPPACHLATTDQLLRLFDACGLSEPVPKALDIGSGDGCLTKSLRPLCRELTVAETSRGMARRLQRQGHQVWREDIAETAASRAKSSGGFSLVSMFNVLDRAACPVKMLRGARQLVERPGNRSWMLLATPLPFVGSYFGRRTRWSGEPLETLPLGGAGADWSSDGLKLIQDMLPSFGFAPRAVSRLPYLTGGDVLDGAVRELDDILVLSEAVEVPKGR